MDNVTIEQTSANPLYAVEVRSYIGGRTDQQDRAYVYNDEQGVFAVVCDGMGGAANGGLASEVAVSAICRMYNEYLTDQTDDPPSFLYRAMAAADKAVSEKNDYKAGGTTLVAILIRNGLLYWVSVGDSRLYILRSGELLQVTRDHNYFLRLNKLKERGEISAATYEKEAVRGDALISYIGIGDIALFDLTQTGFELHHGDKLLLATDGLFKLLPISIMRDLMEAKIALSARADSLIEKALNQSEKKMQDNTTFIILDV